MKMLSVYPIITILLAVAFLFTGCGSTIKASFGEKRTDFNNNISFIDVPLTGGNIPDDFSLIAEAENGQLTGTATVKNDGSYSGGSYVTGLNSKDSTLTFKVTIDYDGMYDLHFTYWSVDEFKINDVHVDGVQVGELKCNVGQKIDVTKLLNVYLSEGEHKISIVPSWGWVSYDCLEIKKSNIISQDTYNVTCGLSNPNADKNTKRLYKFLCDIYGKYSLTGQFADKGRESNELNVINGETGESFAVLGLDMMSYSTINRAHGSEPMSVEYAYDWYNNAGGIVQMCWHWNVPSDEYIADGSHYWNTFYAENTTLDLDKIMNGEDEHGYELLMADIDNIACELSRLRDEGVPIIWRPLHEAAGGWFWWGDCAPESFIKLWQTMYNKMTHEHNLTNLIWMWNGQNADWYPGDEYVDIVSWDIYAGEHQYGSQSGIFAEAVSCYGETKLVALSENGTVMDPDLMFRDNARWLFWGTWSGDFVLDVVKENLSEKYTQNYMLNKAYDSEYTLTLDELPDLKKYPLN